MRIPIALMLAAAVAVSPVPALAQDNNAADAAAPAPADVNMAAENTADANMVVTDLAPPTDTAIANDAAAMPAPTPPSRPFPWGVIGLVGLIGLLGRRRG
jgi:hypothetical protein